MSDALILGIDTTGPADNVALVRGEQILATLSLRQLPLSSRPLLRLIDTVCTQANAGLDEVTAIAVNVGPGAFTGLRVGLATVHGLALAYHKPLVGCTAFEALAAAVTHWQGMICPVVQARKGEVYAAFFRRQDAGVYETHPGVVLTPSALCDRVREPTLFLGSGAIAYRETLTAMLGAHAVCLQTVEAEMGLAVSVARLGSRRLQVAGSAPLPVPQPLYIRAADARLPRIAANAAGVVS
ncbi:MAG: tRNA (adenosine(37)-N6)-threonylcarbamoyltransferase complex dimerization subunit type 1 TsaB [Candidatus Tectomicrobia bacterium]|nr:tRNA (adenosine(37)-N6)-threonylcarbamoyltransferase complex dimerization subunit type 1 TsaB [Candidatus Tectomicrobia bacterium]